MASIRIASTSRASYNALRHQGILATDSFAQIRAMLRSRLSPEHALLFAEPVSDASGATTDWYSEAEGVPLPFSQLPAEEQVRAAATVSRLVSDIEGLAGEFGQSPDPQQRIRGAILSLALRYPDSGHIYMLGEQPVIVCWGFSPGTLGARPQDLVRLGAVTPVAVAPAGSSDLPPGSAVFAWRRALGYFLLGLLLVLLLLGLLFGVPERFSNGCSRPAEVPPAIDPELTTALTAEQEKERSLQQQLADLRAQLREHAAACVRRPPVVEAPKPVPEPAPPAVEEAPSLAELMPTSPEKEEPRQKAPPPPPKKEKTPPAPRKQARGEDMRIPEEARDKNDLSFLEGCWDSETDLRNERTNEPLDVKYCFDASGRGSRTILQKHSRDRCVGSVRARFDASGTLRIDSDSAACGDGGGFVPQQVQCRSSGGKADCFGTERGRLNRKWKARFRRS